MSREKYSNIPEIQTGTATLVAGAVAVTNLFLQTTSQVILTRNSATAPVATELSVAIVSGFGNGTLTIDSSDGADVGAINWLIHTRNGSPAQ